MTLFTFLVITFLLFTIVGGVDTVYLVYKRKRAEAPICPLRGDCTFVLNSKYNSVFGIHTDLIGLAYFIGIVLCLLTWIAVTDVLVPPPTPSGQDSLNLIIATWCIIGIYFATFLAFLMTLRMLFVQVFIIRKMCFWCLLSSFSIIGMFVCLLAIAAPIFG